MAKRYGIHTVSKFDPSKSGTEWFTDRKQRDALFDQLVAAGRETRTVEEDYVSHEEKAEARRALEEQRRHELAVARAGASRAVVDSRRFYGSEPTAVPAGNAFIGGMLGGLVGGMLN